MTRKKEEYLLGVVVGSYGNRLCLLYKKKREAAKARSDKEKFSSLFRYIRKNV